ncbi:hypothetical protein ACJMK2_008547 [Sinanodonta woodiana]|uniref:Golgi integral membrane protein 4 n=1 Tax=Sinanodonta woodiana TaxID=1069815 RepID=A0ABD3VMI1_SINWO
MTRRNGSIIKIIAVAVVLLLAVYFVYLFNDVSGRLKDTERSAERYRREHESVSAQLQDLNAAHEELRQRCDNDKQEYMNRLNSLNQQHKMLKSQHDDMESEYGKLQQENNKVKQDQKQMEEQRNQEYMQLKQEKDLEISNFRDKIANMEREKDKLTKDLENIKVQLQNNMNQLILQQNIINQLKQQGVGQQGLGQQGVGQQGGFVNMQQGGGVNLPQGGGANVQQVGGANLKPLDGTFNQQGGAFHAQEVDLMRERHDQGANNGLLHQQGQGVLKDGAQNQGGLQNIAQNQGFQNQVNQIDGAGQQHANVGNQDLHQQPAPNANDGQHQIAPPVDHNKPQGYQRKEDQGQQKHENVGAGNVVPPEHENKQILKPNLDEVIDNNGGEEHNFRPAHVDGAADKQDPNAPKQVDLQVAPPKLGRVAQQPNQLPGHRDQGVMNFGQEDDDAEARNQKGPVEDDNNDDYNDDKYDKNVEADEDGKDDAL